MNFNQKITLTQYLIAHALVDMTCIAGVYTMFNTSQLTAVEFLPYILLYNFIAFALQAPVGLLVDYTSKPKQNAVISFWILVLAVLTMNFSIMLPVTLFGFANALFHAAGGSIALNLAPFKTTAPGIFVGPGALGLLMGGIIGRSEMMNSAFFISILLLMSFVLAKTDLSEVKKIKNKKPNKNNIIYLALVLIFFVVICRALIGTTLNMPWRSNIILLTTLTVFISLGKGIGGVVADKIDWTKTGLFGLLASAPLLLIFSQVPIMGIIGAFLFQFTMAITLVATYKIFPTRPAFAFGLPCLALFIGALPSLLDKKQFFTNTEVTLTIFTLALIALFFGLKIVLGKKKTIQ